MSSNKSIKEKMIAKYGAKCFIEVLHLRDKSVTYYKSKGQMRRMKALTYHHIKEKQNGGKATEQNGALLSAENHAWFNKQSKEKQAEMNKQFQEYKKGFQIGVAQISSEGVEKTEIIDMPREKEPIIYRDIDYLTIKLFDSKEQEEKMYEERRKQRNARIYKKFENMER